MNNYLISAIGVVKADVLKALEIMGYGVLAIFIVIAILIILVKLMSSIEKKNAEKRSAEGYVPAGDKIKDRFAELKEKYKKNKTDKSDEVSSDDKPQ